MKKYLLVFISLLVFCLGVGGYFVWKRTQSATSHFSGPIETVRLGVSRAAPELSALIYIAENQGYFIDEGIRPIITGEENGNVAQKKVYEGALDMGTAPELAFASDSFEHDNLRAIASIGRANTVEMLFKNTTGITKPADLKGKKIAVPLKSSLEFFLGRYLVLNRLSVRDVSIVDTPFAQLETSITEGDVHVVVANDPFAFHIKSALKKTVTGWPIQAGQDITWLLVSNEDFVTEQPERVDRFLRALLRAEEFVSENNEQSKEIVGQHLNLEKAYLDQSWPKHTFAVRLGQSLLLAMEDEARWRITNKFTEKTKVPNYLPLIYFSALEKLKPEAVTIIR